jgi:hypothetical protein
MITEQQYQRLMKEYQKSGEIGEASDELEAIDWDDRMKPEVLATRAELYLAAKNWELMEAVSRGLAADRPDIPQDHPCHKAVIRGSTSFSALV